MICGIMAGQGASSAALAIGYSSGDRLRVFRTTNYASYTVPPSAPINEPASCAFSPNGELFACLNANATEKILVWQTGLSPDASKWTKVAALSTQPSSASNVVAFSSDNAYLAVGGNITNEFIVYKTSDWSTLPVRDTSPGANVRDIAFSPGSARMAVTSQNGYVTLYAVPAMTKILGLPSVSLDAKALQYSPDGAEIVCGIGSPYSSPYIKRYNSSTLAALTDLSAPTNYPLDECIRFSPDGSLLGVVSGANSDSLSIYRWSDKTKLTTPVLDSDNIASLSFSRDSRYLAHCDQAGPLSIVDTQTMAVVHTNTDTNISGNAVAYSPF